MANLSGSFIGCTRRKPGLWIKVVFFFFFPRLHGGFKWLNLPAVECQNGAAATKTHTEYMPKSKSVFIQMEHMHITPHWQHDLHIKHQSAVIKPRPETRLTFQTKLSARCMNAHLCSYGACARQETSVKHIPRPSSNTLTDNVWAVSQTCIWYFPPNKHSNTLQVKKKKKKKKKHTHLNFNNVSYLNDWKWNYLAPAVFHSTPLLYFCKAIYPLLLSNRATYPGSHLQTARKNWKRWSVLTETGRRSLWVLNCLSI